MRRFFGFWAFLVFSARVVAGPDVWVAEDVSLSKRDTGTFYLAGEIRGYGGLQFLLDTGSSYTVIGDAILKALLATGDAKLSRKVQGTMADGRPKVVPLYRIAAMRLGERCWVHGVEAAVLTEGTRAILGMDVLSRLAPFTFTAEPPQLALSRCLPDAPVARVEISNNAAVMPGS